MSNRPGRHARALACALLVVATGTLAQPPEPPRKYALLVGLNEYRFPAAGVPRLQYATRDVTHLAAVLEDRGFLVTDLANSKAQREDVVAELIRHALITRPHDTFLLYYAGHGVRNRILNEETYWLTYDAKIEALDVSGIRLSHLLDYVRDIRAGRKLILLDHCFSGDIVSSAMDGVAGGRDAPAGVSLERNAFPLEQFETRLRDRGRGMVVFAAARGEAYELEDLQHGLFTHILLQALNTRHADRNEDARLSVDELKSYLATRVRDESTQRGTSQEMVDYVHGNNTSEWFLADLPIEPPDVSAQAELFRQSLLRWAPMEWISIATRNRCWAKILEWEDAVAAGSQAMDDDPVIAALKDSTDPSLPERLRADMLEARISPPETPP